METVTDLDKVRWEKWADTIGIKPTFLFKAALSFIDENNLQNNFEDYLKKLLDSLKETD